MDSRIPPRELLTIIHGPSTIEELGVDQDLLRRSLAEAHLIRMNRYTLLRARNEEKLIGIRTAPSQRMNSCDGAVFGVLGEGKAVGYSFSDVCGVEML